MCAKLSAGTGFGTVYEHFLIDVAARWRSAGGVGTGLVGQWQAAVAAAPPDILPYKFINPLLFPEARELAMLTAQQFSFIDSIRDLDLVLALSNTGSFRRLTASLTVLFLALAIPLSIMQPEMHIGMTCLNARQMLLSTKKKKEKAHKTQTKVLKEQKQKLSISLRQARLATLNETR